MYEHFFVIKKKNSQICKNFINAYDRSHLKKQRRGALYSARVSYFSHNLIKLSKI